jgi:predicted MPP superfamily phosphohydrolase
MLAGVTGVAAFLGFYARFVERAWPALDRFTVTVARPGLPPEGITILHLTDFHFRAGGRIQERKIARLRRLLAEEQYDLLALTGDLIHDVAGFGAALELIKSLRPRIGGFSCPGNHDYVEYSVWGISGRDPRVEDGGNNRLLLAGLSEVAGKLRAFGRKVWRNELVRQPVAFNDVPAMNAALARIGIQPLVNRAVPVQIGNLELWIAGVDDFTEGKPDLAAALAGVPADAPLILLAHNPDPWLEPGAERADLILSGHTHGGQIRLPIIGAVHTQGTHLTRRKAAGWFQRGRTRMFVSRGLGESIPLRLGVPPQVALIRLMPRS